MNRKKKKQKESPLSATQKLHNFVFTDKCFSNKNSEWTTSVDKFQKKKKKNMMKVLYVITLELK